MEIQLQKCAKEYGLFADTERVVPDLYKVKDGKILEAVLDVVIRAPANPRTRYVDVTIRCPHRKGEDTSENAGAMAQRGEHDKERRYGVQAWAPRGQSRRCRLRPSVRNGHQLYMWISGMKCAA